MNQDRCSFDEVFMALALVVSTRSPDPSTRHGAVITNKDNKIISLGYNGSFSNVDDSLLPWYNSDKYSIVSHAEENALDNSLETDLRGATVFVTGKPCHNCLRRMAMRGISTVYYGGITSKCCDEEDIRKSRLILDILGENRIKLIRTDKDPTSVLLKTLLYCISRYKNINPDGFIAKISDYTIEIKKDKNNA